MKEERGKKKERTTRGRKPPWNVRPRKAQQGSRKPYRPWDADNRKTKRESKRTPEKKGIPKTKDQSEAHTGWQGLPGRKNEAVNRKRQKNPPPGRPTKEGKAEPEEEKPNTRQGKPGHWVWKQTVAVPTA
ncbi:hypothetical protein GCM10020221_28660 [Streptomyces thioluteus]|uniref:Uncharacterized protein n=1 Tax=Streptomyces thioluteus TaxID=66431 RepID=A0ABP6JF45_STRTU